MDRNATLACTDAGLSLAERRERRRRPPTSTGCYMAGVMLSHKEEGCNRTWLPAGVSHESVAGLRVVACGCGTRSTVRVR